MSIHIEQVCAYLDAHPLRKYPGDFESLLEMIHYIYTSNNPIDHTEIRRSFQQVDTILASLPLSESDRLFSIVSELCFQHEYTAFSHGILVGLLLMTELY